VSSVLPDESAVLELSAIVVDDPLDVSSVSEVGVVVLGCVVLGFVELGSVELDGDSVVPPALPSSPPHAAIIARLTPIDRRNVIRMPRTLPQRGAAWKPAGPGTDFAACSHYGIIMRFDALTDSGLAFLFTFCTVPVAGCFPVDPDEPEPSETQGHESTSDEPTDTSATSNASASTNASGETTEGVESTGELDSTGEPDTTGELDTTSGGDPTGDPTSSGGISCESYAAHIVACYPQQGSNYDQFVEWCESSLATYGSISGECRALVEDVFACILAADCEILADPRTCATESAALQDACG
jgi:hypothetical protein